MPDRQAANGDSSLGQEEEEEKECLCFLPAKKKEKKKTKTAVQLKINTLEEDFSRHFQNLNHCF